MTHKSRITRSKAQFRTATRGQAAVEYAIISSVLVLAILAIVFVTGPAIGNIFSNVVSRTINNENTTNYPPPPITEGPVGDVQNFETQSVKTLEAVGTKVKDLALTPLVYTTNTPIGPTCLPPREGQWQTAIPAPQTPRGVYISPCP